MSGNSSVPESRSTDAGRVCIHCGKIVDPDRKRLCNHCGLPFRDGSELGPALEEPGLAGRQLLKVLATLAFVLPPLGPLASLSNDSGTLLGFSIVVIAGVAALVFAWRRPLPGGILVALVGIVTFIAGLIVGATTATDPTRLYWTFWFFPGSLVGGALFLAAAFWRAEPSERGLIRPATEGPGPGGLVAGIRREAVGLAVLLAAGLLFFVFSVVAEHPDQPGRAFTVPDWLLAGWPLLLIGAGVLGYREDRVRGSFIAGRVAAVVAIGSMLIAPRITGHEGLQAAPGEGIGEVWLVIGLMIVGGGFFGLLGGGIMALIEGLSRGHARP